MKHFYAIFAAAVLAGTAVAMLSHETKWKKGHEDLLMNSKFAAGFGEEPRPAIDWTWDSWLTGGPTCHDPSRYHIADLSDETLKSVKKSLDAVMNEIVCAFPP